MPDLKSKFPVDLDGQEAYMIAIALREKASRCESETISLMYRVLAQKVDNARQEFHAQTYAAMAPKYDLPKDPS